MSNITIKEQDLHAIIHDLMDKALAINRPNKEKICHFVVNLVENGGNKTRAALDAGYGEEKDKDGKVRGKEVRNHMASTESARLMADAGILSVYESLLSHRFLSKIFVQTLKKEHMVSILYQAGLKGLNSERNFKSGISALVEAGKLAGFYEIDEKDKGKIIDAYKEELGFSADIFDKLGKAVSKLNAGKRLN